MTTTGIYGTPEAALADAKIWNRAASNGCADARVTRRCRYYTVRALAAAADLSGR
jgi:hypothetical protein